MRQASEKRRIGQEITVYVEIVGSNCKGFRVHRWLANLRILEVEEIKSIPYVPVSHPFGERLIGTNGSFLTTC